MIQIFGSIEPTQRCSEMAERRYRVNRRCFLLFGDKDIRRYADAMPRVVAPNTVQG